MTLNLLSASADGIEFILLIAILMVSLLIGAAALTALILRIVIFFQYWVTNRAKTKGGYTGETAALKLLAELGYTDIQVKKCGFFRALFFGNHYNPSHKTVYLLKSALKGDNLTAIGVALQKVGLVIQDKRDSKAFRARWRLQKLSVFGPVLFIPIVLVGVIIDFVTYLQTDGVFTGVGTLVCAIIGIAFFVASFVLSILVIKVEGRANRETLEIMKGYDFLTPDEQEKVAKVFRTYLLAYIMDFIINVLQIIRLILKIALVIVSSKNDGK